MKSRAISLTILLFFGLNFFGCFCNFDPAPEFFDIQDFSVEHRNENNAVVADTAISYANYGYMSCRFAVEYISSPIRDRAIFTPFNPVYGCDPPAPGASGSKEESIVDLQVITINEFDDDHPAGSSLNDIIMMDDFNNTRILLDDYLSVDRDNVHAEWFQLFLTVGPTISQEFQVMVKIELSTGEIYEVETESITFL